MKNLICPLSELRIDKNTVRLTGLLIAVMIAVAVYTGISWIIAFVAVDYFIRAFTKKKFSPVSRVAAELSRISGLPDNKIDKAPKIFAARVGFLFSLSSVVLYFFSHTAGAAVGLALMSFALLESVFDVCVGCIVYTHIVFPFFGD